jgi:hypothetical protein
MTDHFNLEEWRAWIRKPPSPEAAAAYATWRQEHGLGMDLPDSPMGLAWCHGWTVGRGLDDGKAEAECLSF